MINVQVYYTTKDGVKKSRKVSYANPNADKVTLKEFIEALYGLTQNTIREIYRIDTAILLNDDSDDIVTPIVQEESQISLSSTAQTLTQDGNTYSATVNTDEQISITVTTKQDDECSFTITENTNSARNNLSYSNGVITGSFDRSGQIQATVTRTGTDDSVYLVIATSDYDPNSSSDPGMPPMP